MLGLDPTQERWLRNGGHAVRLLPNLFGAQQPYFDRRDVFIIKRETALIKTLSVGREGFNL